MAHVSDDRFPQGIDTAPPDASRRPGILFVSPWLADGGVAHNLQIVAPWFASRGYRVSVLSWQISEQISGRPNPVLETFREHSIPVIRLRALPRLQLIQRAAHAAAIALAGNFRVISGRELMGNLVAILTKFLTAGRVRAIAEIHMHTKPDHIVRTTHPRVLALAKLLYRHADRIVTVSTPAAEEFSASYEQGSELITAIPNPLPIASIRRLSTQQVNPAPHTLGPFILGCGRLVKPKGFLDLVSAFALVRKTRPLKLVILGEGPCRDELLDRAAGNGIAEDLVMPGFLQNPYPFFAGAEAFVLPSYSESFSYVLTEAMACGTPVIATRCGGPEEVLQEGRYGLMCDVGDVEALARHMETLLDDREQAQTYRERSSQRAADFSEDRIMPELQRVYLGT